MGSEINQVLLYSAMAVVAPSVALRLRRLCLPVVAVEILLGIAFGGTGAGLLHDSAVIHFLSEFGLSFLMFLSGLEIDFGHLRRALRPGAARTAASI